MPNYVDHKDFDGIEEPEDEDHQDGSYGGVVETWEPLKIELLSSTIQEFRNQKPSQESYIERIKAGKQIKQEEMQQWLVLWLTKSFAIWTIIGLIALIINKDSGLLAMVVSGTGLFVTLLVIVIKYYFPYPNK